MSCGAAGAHASVWGSSNTSCLAMCARKRPLPPPPTASTQSYLSCMQQKKSTHYRCSDASRDYLECRMTRGLMTEEDLDSLGYAADRRVRSKDIPQAKKEDAERELGRGGRGRGALGWLLNQPAALNLQMRCCLCSPLP